MGGHGRALEILHEFFGKYSSEQLEKLDPVSIVEKVWVALHQTYNNFLDYGFFTSLANCQQLVVAILSRRVYTIGHCFVGEGHSLTVDGLRSFGLFRLTSKGYVECAFIVLLALIRKIVVLLDGEDNFYAHLTRFAMTWQRFEKFVALYRCVKSVAYCGAPVSLSEFHVGARFGWIAGIGIGELHARKIFEAIKQYPTKSSAIARAIAGGNGVSISTDRGEVDILEMDSIVINGTSAPAGDLFSLVQLIIGDQQQAPCNEVLQCKLLQSKRKITAEMYEEEMRKAVDQNVDVFLLITVAEADSFPLPPRCGLVSKSEFDEYFGLFASRAYRSFQEAPNINFAS